MVTNDRQAIDGFLSQRAQDAAASVMRTGDPGPAASRCARVSRWKRLAVIGVSRNAQDFSRSVSRKFEKQGYDVIPVNPGVIEVDGKHCFAHVTDVEPPVDAALLFTPSDRTEEVVDECIRAENIAQVAENTWRKHSCLQRSHSCERVPGFLPLETTRGFACREHGISIVAGECPFMFLPNAAWPHRFHDLIRKVTGNDPN